MIFVIGDVMLDSYIFGEVERISPEAPVPIVKKTKSINRLGGAANVANILVSNSIAVSIISSVYDDEAGRQIINLCNQFGIQNDIKVNYADEGKTPHKTRVVANNQQICRVDDETLISASSDEIIRSLNKGIEFNICIISDYGKGTLKDLVPITKYLLDKKVKILVDPKDSNIEKYNGVYLIKPNLKEFKNFLSAKKIILENDSIENLRDAAISLISRTNIENILITLNHRGSLHVACDGSYRYYQQDEVKVSDVTGAGDHVLAFLAIELSREQSLNTAIKRAMQAAIIAVQKFGTEPVFAIELPMKNLSYDISVNEKLRLIKQMRLGGQKIVFTNGCFDILHIGHLDLLRKAKKLGDKLIVAVNSDQSVRRLKGKQRPINSLSSRIKMLEALSSVDVVIPFNEDTPLDLINEIRPTVLVKGSDYKVSEVVGYDEVVSWGGKVVTIDLTDDFSTSKLIQKARQ